MAGCCSAHSRANCAWRACADLLRCLSTFAIPFLFPNRSRAMKRLALLAGSLALCAGGLALLLYARPGNATAPPVNGKAKAEAPPKMATSRITQVTVYPDSALVTREVEVPAGEGVMELVVSPLPQATVNSSLYSEGSEGTRVLTTRFRSRPVLEDTREEVRKLEDEIKKLTQRGAARQANIQEAQGNSETETSEDG